MSLLLALTASGGGTSYADDLSAGAYVITGQALTDAVSRVDSLSAGAYSIDGNSLTDTVARADSLAAGAYSIVGNDLTDVYTPAGGTSYADDLSAGAYTISGGELQDVIDVFEAVGGGNGGKRRKPKRRIYVINGIRYLVSDDSEIEIKEPLQDAPEIVESIDVGHSVEYGAIELIRSAMMAKISKPVIEQKTVVKTDKKHYIQEEDEEELMLMMF